MKRNDHQTLLPIAGAFLLGCAITLWTMSHREGLAVLVGITGILLVMAFRLFERRALEHEDRIARLESVRRTLDVNRRALEDLFVATVENLAAGVDARIPAGSAPALRAQRCVEMIGREMGLHEDALSALRMAALVRDVGNVRVPVQIWANTGALSDEERGQMQRHVLHATALLERLALPWPVAGIVRSHHERWDGKGYPDRLHGESIPIGARVLAVADAYTALIADRPHRVAYTPAQAMRIVLEGGGTAFDPAVVAAFRRAASRPEFAGLDGSLPDLPLASCQNGKSPA